MKRHLARTLTALALTGALVTLAACSGGASGSDANGKWTSEDQPLRIWSDNRPHSEILQYIIDEGLLSDDVTLDITLADYNVNENETVENGDVDATYIDHIPFFETDTAERGITDLQVAAKVHIEPQGLYSAKYDSIDDIPDDATIGIPDNVTNFARGLFLLQSAGLIELDRSYDGGELSGDDLLITEDNITSNPKNIQLLKVSDNTQLARQLQDVDAAVLQGNAALGVDLVPSEDALVLEDSQNGNPYINVLVVPTALADDKRVVALSEALESQQVADWITETYQGSVLPVNHVD
ncbi:MAG: MetQ/NlpA family ABC transporter substrate-binding protein [Microbacterium sp.]